MQPHPTLDTAAMSLTVQAEAHSNRPTIVLVHGAWADSTSWDKVTWQLRDGGYRTVTPELGLNSVAEDVAIISTALNRIPGRKVLVSHSYGEGFAGEDQVPEGLGRGEVVASSQPAPPTLAAGSSCLHLFHQYFAQDLTGIRPCHAGNSIWRMGRYGPLVASFNEGRAVLLIKIDADVTSPTPTRPVRLDARSAA
jgi:hypothetical protein